MGNDKMKFLLALCFLSPLLAIAAVILWEEFETEVKSIYSGTEVKKRKKKEIDAVENEFPAVVELFAILVAAGMSPSTALLRISERAQGSYGSVLRSCINEMRHGAPLAQALEMVNQMVASQTVRRFNDSILIAMERGTSLTEVVTRQVEEVRQSQRTSMLEKAGKAEISLMIPVVFLILPISVLFALWPSYFALGQSMGF
ncbi:MAG: hypothetical protein RL414_449 [Actinomycetota bacterium]|jgi:tight adherence protein C